LYALRVSSTSPSNWKAHFSVQRHGNFRPGSDLNVISLGHQCAQGSNAGTHSRTNPSSFSATSHCADERPGTSTTPNESHVTLGSGLAFHFAFLSHLPFLTFFIF
jgi:hypothetical protein